MERLAALLDYDVPLARLLATILQAATTAAFPVPGRRPMPGGAQRCRRLPPAQEQVEGGAMTIRAQCFTELWNAPGQRSLGRREYIARMEPVLMVGNPGVRKTDLGHRVGTDGVLPVHRGPFCIAASVINDLIQRSDCALRRRIVLKV